MKHWGTLKRVVAIAIAAGICSIPAITQTAPAKAPAKTASATPSADLLDINSAIEGTAFGVAGDRRCLFGKDYCRSSLCQED